MVRRVAEAVEWQEGRQINLAGGALTKRQRSQAGGGAPVVSGDGALRALPEAVLKIV